MQRNPEISAVIVAYNHGAYIREAIESVLGQTFQDFEIIVFDDGSTDNTRQVVSAIPDKRLRYFYQENSGLPACGRNRGMALSRGRYISLLDADDFWKPQKLENCKRILDKFADIGLVCHNEAIIHNGRVLKHTHRGPYYVEDMYSRLLFEGNCLHSSAVMLRKEIFFDQGFRFSEERSLFTIEDYEYWLRLSQVFRFYFLPEVLGYYRVTDSGAFLRSAESNTINMLNLVNSHFGKIDNQTPHLKGMIKKRRSAIMCAAGRMFHHKNEFRQSRDWYLKALREDNQNCKALICYLAALLRLRVLYR